MRVLSWVLVMVVVMVRDTWTSSDVYTGKVEWDSKTDTWYGGKLPVREVKSESFVKVQKGETLSGIVKEIVARDMWGESVNEGMKGKFAKALMGEVLRMNVGMEADRIKAGQEIRVSQVKEREGMYRKVGEEK